MSSNAEWEPEQNTYVLTVVLSDVRKSEAIEASRLIEEVVLETYPEIGDILVTAAHVKHNVFNGRLSR